MENRVTERPILFSGPMVRAILDGRKTQTRRVVAPSNSDVQARWEWLDFDAAWPDMLWGAVHGLHVPTSKAPPDYCPECSVRLYSRIEAGDLLWVRETWAHVPFTAYVMSTGVQQTRNPDDWDMAAVYRAGWERSAPGRWRPSIHMPKWAARIWLRVTDVRVERLQDITEDDAIAEGVELSGPNHDHVSEFAALWDSLNESRGYGWHTNPWVWRIAFERARAPHEQQNELAEAGNP